jgi:hypothetical protein
MLPFEYFPIHQSSHHPTVYSVDTDSGETWRTEIQLVQFVRLSDRSWLRGGVSLSAAWCWLHWARSCSPGNAYRYVTPCSLVGGTNVMISGQSVLQIIGNVAKKKTKLHGLSSRANYTDRATAACRRSDCQLLRIEGATWSAWRTPMAVFSVF